MNTELLNVLTHPAIQNDDVQFDCVNGDCGQFAIALSEVFGGNLTLFAVLAEDMFDDEIRERLEQCEDDEEQYKVLEDCEGIIQHVFVFDGTDFFDVSGEVTINDMGEYDDHNTDPVIWDLGQPCEELKTLIRRNTAYCESVDYYKDIIQRIGERQWLIA